METLTAAVKIRAGKEDSLRQVLCAIDADIKGNPYMQLARSRLTHFLRFVILDDPDNGPRLLMATNYDGTVAEHVRELVAISPGLDEVWNNCAEYSGKASFATVIQRNSFPSQAVYLGFADETVESLRTYIAVRAELERILGLNDVARYLDGPDPARLMDLLGSVPRDSSPAARVGGAAAAVTASAQEVARNVFREAFLWAAQRFSQMGEQGDFNHQTIVSADANAAGRQTEQSIDIGGHTVQNEMTTLTTVRPERLTRLKFALAASNALFKFGYPVGEFATVGTLHSFAWVLMDNDAHLLFLSAFDGSWQNYLGDFSDKLVWGLDGLYSNTYDYPRVGMRDLGAFTNFILGHQFPHLVFYSAYPRSTVMNLLRDRQLSLTLAGRMGRKGIQRWLQLL